MSVNNDFHKTQDIFDIFEGLSVADLDKVEEGEKPADGAATQ